MCNYLLFSLLYFSLFLLLFFSLHMYIIILFLNHQLVQHFGTHGFAFDFDDVFRCGRIGWDLGMAAFGNGGIVTGRQHILGKIIGDPQFQQRDGGVTHAFDGDFDRRSAVHVVFLVTLGVERVGFVLIKDVIDRRRRLRVRLRQCDRDARFILTKDADRIIRIRSNSDVFQNDDILGTFGLPMERKVVVVVVAVNG